MSDHTLHTFACPNCGTANNTSLQNVDKSVACANCSAEVVVPRPRVRLAMGKRRRSPPVGGHRSAPANPQPVQQAVERKQVSPALSHESLPDSAAHRKISAGAGTVGATNAGTGNGGEPDSRHRVAPRQRRSPKPDQKTKLDAQHGLGFLTGAVLGLVLYFVFVGDLGYSQPVMSETQVQAQVELILQRWRAAEKSRAAIDEDLAITLAEMELNQMDEEAGLVRRAIENHKLNIQEDFDLSLTALLSVSKNYATAPSATENAIDLLYNRLQEEQAADYVQTLDLLTRILYANQNDLEGVNQAYKALWAEYH